MERSVVKLTAIVIGGVCIGLVAFSPQIIGAVDAVSNSAVGDQLQRFVDAGGEMAMDDPEVLKEWLSALPAAQVALLMFVIWYRHYLGPFVAGLLMVLLFELRRALGHPPQNEGVQPTVPPPPTPTPGRRKTLAELSDEFNPRRSP
jgi:hypothetical protein